MDLDIIEKEINDIMNRLGAEAAILEKGNKFVDHARRSSEQVLGIANSMLESFNQVKGSFESLEKRVGDINFTTYFSNLKETVGQLDPYMSQVNSSIAKISSDILESKKLISDTNLSIDKNVRDLLQKIENGYADVKGKINLFQTTIEKLIQHFDEVGFHQRFKDIEHTMVKFSVEQESIKKNIDLLVNKHIEVMQLIERQSKKSEEMIAETKLEVNILKNEQLKLFKIVIIFNTVITLGIGVLIFKVF